MNGCCELQLYAVDCAECGRPTVTSELCERPDLCWPCFVRQLETTPEEDEMNKVAAYEMNPAEDYLVFGDELKDGMWVIREDWAMRSGGSEDRQIRMNRFCRVTRLRTMDAGHGPCAVFIGEWIDGYQEAFTVHHRFAWIVKRDPITSPDSMFREITGEDPS